MSDVDKCGQGEGGQSHFVRTSFMDDPHVLSRFFCVGPESIPLMSSLLDYRFAS